MSLESKLAEFAVDQHPSQAVTVLERLDPVIAGDYLESGSTASAATVIQRLSPQHKTIVLERMDPARISKILALVSTESAVRMLRPIDDALRNEVLKVLEPKKARAVNLMLGFKDGTAGALMDPDALALPQELYAKDALQRVRKQAESTRYNLYIVDQEQHLTGAMNLRELLVASGRRPLSELMIKNPFRVLATADRALMIANLGWNHVHSLPVVDSDDVFLGVIRYRTIREIEANLHNAQRGDSDTGAALGQIIVAAAGGILDALAGQARAFEEANMATRKQASAEEALASWLLSEKPDEAVLLLENADPPEVAKLLDSASLETNLGIMRRLTPSRGAQTILALSETTRQKLLSTLSHNRVVALLGPLSGEERELCLGELDSALADELRDLLHYPPETAGSLMDPRAISFRPEATMRDVIKQLRRHRERRVQDVFVVESSGKLIGSVPLESIVLADNAALISTLIEGEPTSVMAVASRDEIIRTFDTHRIGNLPVVDIDQHLVGVLRQREILQAAKERATASAVTMVGASEQERALSSPWFAIRKRLPWLQINLLTAFLAAAVVGLFEDTIANVTALAVLLPVVAGQSGNTGAQALAVTMRGLALREVHARQWFRIAIKEAIAGAGNGIAVAIVTSIAVYFWSDSIGLASVICVSMVISMTLAGLSGAVIPMALTSFGMDPAQSSSIVLTTVTDVVGFFSFLGIATIMVSSI